jgi:hypothetical protein
MSQWMGKCLKATVKSIAGSIPHHGIVTVKGNQDLGYVTGYQKNHQEHQPYQPYTCFMPYDIPPAFDLRL